MASEDGKDIELRLLMAREVAELLRVSVSSVYALVAQGRIPCHRIGAGRGSIRVSRTDLEAFLNDCRSERVEEVRRLPRPSAANHN